MWLGVDLTTNTQKNMYSKEIELFVQNTLTILISIVPMMERGYDHLMDMQIFTLIMKKISI
jgi:hypothetical protein